MRPQVFIEKIMPVNRLNEQVSYESGGNPFKGLHRWYSRKPLSFSRASVLGSILPADVTPEEFEQLLGLIDGQDIRLYKTPPSPHLIEKVQNYCETVWGTKTPTVLDAFAGGGSIPFEAVRYGLKVLASDLNPVAVVTMKAAMEYPLKFGAELQEDIDKWVKWVGDEAEKRLAEFFPSNPSLEGGGQETVQNYLWAHTVVCPSCESVVPLSPNWWLYKRPEKQNLHKWCAVKPIPNPKEKRVDFELIKGKKGKGTTIETEEGEFDPKVYDTVSRSVGKCPNCSSVIEEEAVKSQAQNEGLGHQLYAVAYKEGKSSLQFRVPSEIDFDGVEKAKQYLAEKSEDTLWNQIIPNEDRYDGYADRCFAYGLTRNSDYFNPRQLLTLVTYVEIINEAKAKIQAGYEPEKAIAIITYLALVLDRCVDTNCRLSLWDSSRAGFKRASTQHALNLMWNYPETSGKGELWKLCVDVFASEYNKLCQYLGTQSNSIQLKELEKYDSKSIQIDSASADSLFHIPDNSVDTIVTDPPYYATIQYAELSDFFYAWQKRILDDIFPELFLTELTDKDREAVANPSRFRNMGVSPDELASQDYEGKMQMAFAEYYRVLKEHGVMTVQFNHKDSGAWDVLTKSLIDAGFEITASWAVSTESPQNLHQAKKNSVSSTVLLVCRKRDPNAEQAWWDDLRPEVANLVESRAPDFEANDITGIDLYLSAFGPALNVFSRSYPILDSTGEEVRPEKAFAEARTAIANYRFQKLVQSDTAGFDTLTQWYLLAWDAFKAREFPFDEARQLALAIGGFNVSDLAKVHKLLDSASGSCKLLTPVQRLKRRAFSINPQEFSAQHLVNGLHAIIAIYQEEENIQMVRRFMHDTGLVSNDMFSKTMEVAFKVIPQNVPEHKALLDLWLAMDEIKSKVVYEQMEINLDDGQMNLEL